MTTDFRTDVSRGLLRDIRFHERSGTDRRQPPLLLINGIGARLELLQPFVDEVDPRITVVRFDVPGIGDSPLPRLPYRFCILADAVAAAMRRLGHRRFDALGISWGGGLAQQLALQHPRACRRLVLCATATGSVMVPAHPRVLSHLVTPRRYRDTQYTREVAARLYGGRMRTEPALAATVLAAGAKPRPGRGYTYQLLAGLGWTSLPFLPLIRQRTLVLAGRDDPIIPLPNSRIFKALLPHAAIHLYDDGHLGLVTSADQLAPVVSNFLLSH